jgi:hypothetical protein
VSKENLFQELSRLVYRIIFLLTVEERRLLHPEASEPEARSRYAEGYSLRRLALRAARRDTNDRYMIHGTARALCSARLRWERVGWPCPVSAVFSHRTSARDSTRLTSRRAGGPAAA